MIIQPCATPKFIHKMYLASKRRGVAGHFVVSVVVTALESAPAKTPGRRVSNASKSFHILPEPMPNQKEGILIFQNKATRKVNAKIVLVVLE